MSAGTSELFCLICFLVCSCTAQTNIKAEFGQDVILPCKAPNNKITAVEWRGPERDPDYSVLLYRGGRLDLVNQHSSYKNRVYLQDKEMKDGNVSLILKNVTIEDTGRFECHVDQGGTAELISSIILVVVGPDNSWENQDVAGLVFGVFFVASLLLAAVLYVCTRRHESEKKTLVKQKEEELELLKENHSDTKDQLQQEKQKNEILKNQLEKLKGNNSETNNQLQEEKQKWETVNIHLEEWMKIGGKLKNQIQNQIQELDEMNSDTNSDPTGSDEKNQQEELKKLQGKEKKLMKTVGSLKTELQKINKKLEPKGSITVEEVDEYDYTMRLRSMSTQLMETGGKVKNQIQIQIQNLIQKLDEINFDTNSDRTGSDEKNQQEELKKLQDENKKLMKTVGNLKTELQNMNQKLELIGPITIEKFKPEEHCICLRNISTQEINLEGWKLELRINDREPVIYSFKESDRIQAGGIFTLSGLKKKNPGDELQMKLISNNGEIFRLV